MVTFEGVTNQIDKGSKKVCVDFDTEYIALAIMG